MAITIGFSDYSINLQLNATDFALTQIKLKNNYEDSDGEQEELSEQEKMRETIFLRMSAMKDMEKVLDALFAEFLTIRLSSYAEEIKRMRQHVDERLEKCLGPGRREEAPAASDAVPW
ncbi:MAG: hypothetical protein BWZ03_00625 [bacterium ADurb.BinA186]|nr:MAG: hypothetical protein BWZ03_00625 [bacterium ADurb.BinA186]